MTLLDYLAAKDISLEEFAKRIGTSQPSLWRYAHGERRIPADLAVRIERATGRKVRVEDLIPAEEERP